MSRVEGIGLRSPRGPVLLAMMLATAVVAVDTTVLATAVPSIVGELGGFESFPWLFSAYLLASAATVPVYSKLADTIGRKPLLVFGLAVFLAGSVLCAFAWDMTSLIAFRAVQGLGAGAIQPLSVTIIGDIYSIAERAKVQAYTSSVWAVSSVLGPTIGGIFAQLGAWRGIFFATVPLSIAAVVLVLLRYHERLTPRRHRIDFAGSALVTAGLALLILGLLEGGRAWAWISPTGIGVFAVAAVLLVAFALVERKAAEPVLPPALFRSRSFVSTMLVMLSVGAGLIGLTAFVPSYLQVGAGVLPIVAGAALATQSIGWPLASALSGRVYLRRGFAFTMTLGAALVLLGTAVLAIVAPFPSPWIVAPLCLVIGFGFGFVSVPGIVAVQSSVPWDERAVATGSLIFARSLGQAAGAAVLGAVANAVIFAHGGDETDPETFVAASGAVFLGAAAIALVLFIAVLTLPRDRRPGGGDDPDQAVAGT